jgi:hypothetical protein
LTDLQSQGIRAASEIATRLNAMLDWRALEGPVNDPHSGEDPDPRDDPRSTQQAAGDMRTAAGRLIDIYGNILQRTFDAYADLIERRAGSEAHLDGGSAGIARVEARAGELAEGEVWIASGADHPIGPLTIVATHLSNSTRAVISSEALVFEPSVVASLEAKETKRIALLVKLPEDTKDGYYHGHVLLAEMPGEAVPITVAVVPQRCDSQSR